MPLQKQVITIPISAGLDNKTDPFQVMAGKALALENARFYKLGKLQKRFGYVAMTTTTDEGDLSVYDKKAIVADGDSVNLLTSGGVFAYSEGLGSWEKLSEMKDSVKIKTDFLSKSAYNHFNPDMDYNEYAGLMVTVYREKQEDNDLYPTSQEYVTIVLEDVLTGLKKIRKIDTGETSSYKKAQQKVMLTMNGANPVITAFYDVTGNNLVHHVMDKNLDDISASTVIETMTLTQFLNYKMDVCRDNSNIFHGYMRETTLKLRKLDLSGSISTTATKTVTNRLGTDDISDNGLGFSLAQSENDVHVSYISNTTVSTFPAKIVLVGYAKSTLALSITETSSSSSFPNLREISTCLNGSQLVMATTEFDAASAYGICTVNKFTATWSSSYSFTEPALSNGVHRSVTLSRPFMINGEAHVICKCPESDQLTGLIYNMDAEKFNGSYSPFGLSTDRLAISGNYQTGTCNAVCVDDVVFSAIEKTYGGNTNSISAFDFNANVAIAKIRLDYNNRLDSGTKTKIGETNYYTNGSTFSLDSRGAYESGFALRPLIKSVTSNTSGSTNPNVAGKTFNYIAVYNFYNGKGEIERSIPSPAVAITTNAATTYVSIVVKNHVGSYKNSYYFNGSTFTQKYVTEIVLYRTQNGGSTFNRVSSAPSNQTSDTVTISDASADTDIINNELLYTTGAIVENDSTPNAKFSTAGGNRMFLGGLEEDDEIAYSKKQLFGEAVAFSDLFKIRISSGTSSDKSKMSALGYMDGKLIIFRENSIYYIAGDGPLETGLQDTFTEPEVISSDTGCIQPRSVVNIPSGLLFKSKKGIYLLDRSLQVSYAGSPVEDFNSEGIVSAIVSDKFNEARFYTDGGNCLVYNYLFEQWSVFQGQTSIDADIWAGNPVQIMGDGVSKESEISFSDNGIVYTIKVKTPWLKLTGIQDFGRIWSVTILGKYKSAHSLIVKARYDYDDAYTETYTINPEETDSQYQYRVSLKKQLCESVQFEIYDADQLGESMELSALTIEAGLRIGSMKVGATRKY